MPVTTEFTIRSILIHHKSKVIITWLMVALENALTVVLPLFIGFTIDGLLRNNASDLYFLAALLVLIIVVSVARNFYDTRIYGAIRVEVGEAVDKKMSHHLLSVRNARLNMSRELVDFLENDIPPLMTAVIQLIASVIILTFFHLNFGVSALIASTIMLMVYALFHDCFIRLNHSLNNQTERQVTVLSCKPFRGVRVHLERIKRREIMISDAEAVLYGLIFLVLFGFVITNLWLSARLNSPTAGQIFSVVTYSLEFLEAAVMLPITLQTLSRLSEISQRLNSQSPTEASQESHQ
ncbi:ABC transporter permease [Vibrio albus]|uniref:ABC transporter permease n=1 Tax=Vibrio albus TaxID=2200953 RepID=A0A2U3B552_9VIBR|nr:ABC transporter six-transmembrane domain-containing protein [Vibrio albus]PWI31931.1 ABC transporter permease [Vibrio albus]